MSLTTTQLRGTVQTLLSTELNSLANNANAISGSVISVTSAGYFVADIEGYFTFGTAPTANTGFSVWFLSEIDGTNYEDGGSSVTPARAPDCVIPVRAVTTAQRSLVKNVPIPPGNFYCLIQNNGTGQSLAASGNTVKMRPTTPISQ